MEKDSSRTGKRTCIVLIAVIAAVILTGALLCACRADRDDAGNDGGSSEEAAEQTEEASETAPRAVLLFASDYQEGGYPLPDETFASLLHAAKEDGKQITNVIMCGDYSNVSGYSDHQIAPDEYIEEIRRLISEGAGDVSQDDVIFVQGNHDAMSDAISESGLHEYKDYLVYVLNTESDYPWTQGDGPEKKDTVMRAARDLRECLDGLAASGETRPVFIAGHVPLHFTARTSSVHSTGDNMYAGYIFDAVNEAAGSLDVIYVFGHNHSNSWDSYLGGSCVYKSAGDTVLIPAAGESTAYTDEYSEEKLNFTYMNAGFTGYYHSGGTDTDDALTCTVAEIYGDRIVITRYDAEGMHLLCGSGTAGPEGELIGPEHYSRETAGPVIIKRKSVFKSGTIKEDGTDDKKDKEEKDAA